MNRFLKELMFWLACLHLAQHGGMIYNYHPTAEVFWTSGRVAFDSQVVRTATLPTDVVGAEGAASIEPLEALEIEGADELNQAQLNALNQLYIGVSFLFMCSDMVIGAGCAALGDLMGPRKITALLSVLIALSYACYFYSVGSPYGDLFLKLSAIGQGSAIVGFLSALMVIGDWFPLKGLLPRAVRLMIISGSCEFSMFVPNIINDLIANNYTTFNQSVWFLIVTSLLFGIVSMFLLPDTQEIPESSEEEASLVKSNDFDGIAEAYRAPPVSEESDKPLNFMSQLLSPSYLLYAVSWTLMLWCMNTQNGSCISHTVKLVYGEDSFWMTFLDRWNWFGIVPSIVIGYFISFSVSWCHLFLIMCCFLTSLIMVLQKQVWLGVIIFYLYKGSMYGSLGAVVALVAEKSCKGRLLGIPPLIAGLVFTFTIGYLNDMTLREIELPQIPGEPPVMPVTDFSVQQSVTLAICMVQFPLWYMWRRAYKARVAAQQFEQHLSDDVESKAAIEITG